MAVTERVGVFGGTFDPIHLGHLIAAEDARERLGLDEVLFIPAGQPWFKAGAAVSAAQHRLAMARLAVKGNPRFRVSDIEIRRPGPSYTIDTLEALAAERPGAELYVLLGLDALREMRRWRDPGRVFAMARVVGMARPGASLDFAELDAAAPDAVHRALIVDGPRVDISGTDIRRRIAAGLSVRYRLPSDVADYARRHGLYKSVS